MSDSYYDYQHGIIYHEGKNPKRFTGCVPAYVQAAEAMKAGVPSDAERIAALAAPWDLTDQPAIINWSDNWKRKLQDDANAYNALRDAGKMLAVWNIAKLFRYNLRQLCGIIQKTNDCTAWAISRCATCLALYQKWLGAEIDIEAYNPMGVYCYSSGETPKEWNSVANNGRTIYRIAETACQVGNFPVSAIGKYTGEPKYTPLMLKSVEVAKENQMGFVYLGDMSAEEKAEIVILSLCACRPVIIGNMVALRDGTHKSADGVYVSDVGGSWGGGHATAAVDIKKVGDRYYPWIYNSHGSLYGSPDGSPDEGTYITREGLARYLSGSFADVMLTTFMKRPRVEYYNLNPGGAI